MVQYCRYVVFRNPLEKKMPYNKYVGKFMASFSCKFTEKSVRVARLDPIRLST